MRHASRGSAIKVYSLFNIKNLSASIGTIYKKLTTEFQPPSCSLPSINGIVLPMGVNCPIKKTEYSSSELNNYEWTIT